ncbi:hypothetical protein WJX73_002690 [Symbiochloris irregularis]|uniref:Protein kinase domain-containing protein n=1 Tax=Symbiochloris irregularis TaxID=706552 RepID=A0AAW1NN52_9CHLO
MNNIHSLHGAKAARRLATTELLFFCRVGDVARCQKICDEFQIDPRHAQDYDKRTALHLAAAEGCYSVVTWLLSNVGVDVNPIDRFNRTPLEEAVRGDFGDVADLLLQAGAKVYLEDEQKLVPLEKSALARYHSVYDRFCKDGDDDDGLQPEWEINRDELELLNQVGTGEYGTVYRAKWLGSIVAVKVLKGCDAVTLGDLRTELHVLQKIHHPHCTQFLGACTRQTPYMIVTEFIPGGSLADFFKIIDMDHTRHPTLRRAVQIALGCAYGMRYMHARRRHLIIHRDLKPANLMLGGMPPDIIDRPTAQKYGVCKIADFGLSKSLALGKGTANNAGVTKNERQMMALQNDGNCLNEVYQLTGETGSYRYMSPEVFRHEPYNSKVDVYAFAMIAYELFEGSIPFGLIHPIQAARQAGIEGVRPIFKPQNRWGKKLPSELKDLVAQCWAPMPGDRPDFHSICTRLEAVLDSLPVEKADKKKKECIIM